MIDNTIRDKIDLNKLIEKANDDYVNECRNSYGDKIRTVFQRQRALSGEIKKLQNQIAKATEKLNKTKDTIEEIKKGNWDVVDNLKKDNEDN